jgi:hypothetical protein
MNKLISFYLLSAYPEVGAYLYGLDVGVEGDRELVAPGTLVHPHGGKIVIYGEIGEARYIVGGVAAANLTPHEINLHLEDGGILTIPPSGVVARTVETSQRQEDLCGIPVFSVKHGGCEIPPAQKGVVYIVSALALGANPDRTDLFSPYGLVRDGEGRIIGCKGLQAGWPEDL